MNLADATSGTDSALVESDLEWTIRRQSGVISRRQALRHLHPSTLRRHLANGRWQIAHRGIYVTHNGPLTRSQRVWVGLLAVGAGTPRVALGGFAALVEDGYRFRRPELIDVYLPAGCELQTHRRAYASGASANCR